MRGALNLFMVVRPSKTQLLYANVTSRLAKNI